MPVFSLVFDRDVNATAVMKYPPLYATLQKGRELNMKTFLVWLWMSIFQVSKAFLLIRLTCRAAP
jgi:phospholipid-translocating ATPase